MTPRRIMATMIVAGKRVRVERATTMNLMATAFRSDAKQLKAKTDELLRD
jgi:hypothetical protein